MVVLNYIMNTPTPGYVIVDNEEKGKYYIRIILFNVPSTVNAKHFYESYLPISWIFLCTKDDTYTKRFSGYMMLDKKQKAKYEVRIVLYMSSCR